METCFRVMFIFELNILVITNYWIITKITNCFKVKVKRKYYEAKCTL